MKDKVKEKTRKDAEKSTEQITKFLQEIQEICTRAKSVYQQTEKALDKLWEDEDYKLNAIDEELGNKLDALGPLIRERQAYPRKNASEEILNDVVIAWIMSGLFNYNFNIRRKKEVAKKLKAKGLHRCVKTVEEVDVAHLAEELRKDPGLLKELGGLQFPCISSGLQSMLGSAGQVKKRR